jgi:bifunctional DNA-binding transcriptional regulator/antitoxin component of YhaV-PrlF toxin-antitoxin module
MASRVSDRGQITIDRLARKELNVEPGMVAYQRVVGGRLEVVFLPAPHRRSLYGVCHQGSERSSPALTQDQLENAVMEAVAEERKRQSDESG